MWVEGGGVRSSLRGALYWTSLLRWLEGLASCVRIPGKGAQPAAPTAVRTTELP